jgi:diguanylate cyclase (GGDEF)-like protein
MARWGGEEFLVVLPGAGPAETVLAAERLRAALHAMPGPGGEAGEVTASFGVSVLGQGESTLEAAILRADSALYGAKGHGRDRVTSDLVEPAVAPKRGARGGTGRQRAPI